MVFISVHRCFLQVAFFPSIWVFGLDYLGRSDWKLLQPNQKMHRPRALLISPFVCGFCLFIVRVFCIWDAHLPFVKIQNVIYSRWNVCHYSQGKIQPANGGHASRCSAGRCSVGWCCFLSKSWLLHCGAFCTKSIKLSLCSLRWARGTVCPRDPSSFAHSKFLKGLHLLLFSSL